MIIVMGGEGSQKRLIAQPEIEQRSSGKTLIVDAPEHGVCAADEKIFC